ncbi:MAG: hypothetical protein FJ045_00455 [Crenarchaeota archaeon]|nr:hypothetical protein [Thermoproteota archaeon]
MARNSTNSGTYIPSKQQLAFLEAYLSQEVDSTIESICQASGVPRRTYYNWRENSHFNDWFLYELRDATDRFTPAVIINLFKKASSSDATAALIELALEFARLLPKEGREPERATDEEIERRAAEEAIKLLAEAQEICE